MPHLEVVPEIPPAVGDALGFEGTRRDEITYRLEAVRPEMQPIRVSPVDRITKDDDQSCVRDQAGDPVMRGLVIQIERGALPAHEVVRAVEQRLVVCAVAN